MIRLPAVIISTVVALAVVGYFVFKGGSTPQISKDVTSVQGDGAKSDSLFHADALGKAVKKFNDKFPGAKITTLKVEANSIKATTDHGIQVVGKHGETDNLSSGGIDTSGGQAGFSSDKIDSSVPAKIVAALASKGVTMANVNYFVLQTTFDGSATKPGWLVYTYSKGNFEAHYDGSHAKPLGSGSVDTSSLSNAASNAQKTADNATKAAQNATKGAQSTADCIAAAGTDASKIQACATGG